MSPVPWGAQGGEGHLGLHEGGSEGGRPGRGHQREGTPRQVIIAPTLLLLLFLGAPALAAIPAPEGFRALDTPNDAGKSLSLVWNAFAADRADRIVQVWMADRPDGPFKKVAEFPSNTRYVKPGDFPLWAQPARKGNHSVKLAASQAF